jgi:hypothetical protein
VLDKSAHIDTTRMVTYVGVRNFDEVKYIEFNLSDETKALMQKISTRDKASGTLTDGGNDIYATISSMATFSKVIFSACQRCISLGRNQITFHWLGAGYVEDGSAFLIFMSGLFKEYNIKIKLHIEFVELQKCMEISANQRLQSVIDSELLHENITFKYTVNDIENIAMTNSELAYFTFMVCINKLNLH